MGETRMKQYADKHQRELEFQPGGLVLLKLKPHRLRSLAKKVNEKLSPRFYGPFKVMAKIGKVAYQLRLLETARIHHVFHISQLKRFLGQEFRVQPIPPQLSEELELVVTPEAILNVHCDAFQMDIIREVLVKWAGLPDCEATWEPLQSLQDVDVRFPKSSGMLDIADKSAETEKQIQEIRWQKDKFQDDIKREITLLNKAKGTFATKKAEFLKFLAQSSSYASQFVYVSHFDLGTRVPIVSRLKAVPKRRPCVGTLKDLVLSDLLLVRVSLDFKNAKKNGLVKRTSDSKTKSKRVSKDDKVEDKVENKAVNSCWPVKSLDLAYRAVTARRADTLGPARHVLGMARLLGGP
ncbi:hypothetical protein QYF36_020417 [Acer negundo]|nr:hypothetical protein QYF36_020417 [Acer negundo]